ncbi:TonB-dependent receptor [Stakelama tenebrarum]|uniref:TonB-dependent receptor n=1 Tax=Stakelama tenebrarum TaxID=2711215 RepID=A0A6G6YA32_9SPHN|nr:TonB-dependent receptor [Sphingosinithalassobacter tenebrarum]QIG81433.1 TonB-dependent receptor [Sphingosinithalassobacter tenebrarum]
MIRFALLASACLTAFPAAAQQAQESEQTDPHEETAPEIIITAPFARAQVDVLSGTSVVSGEELTRSLKPTIGDTLASQPGVSATSFGPNASRPVLRGFQGERIRVLTDGIGSVDVSNTSVDHAVAINPLTADRIEVLRGPAALLYGSSAIGGVVNVIDNSIARRLPEEPFHAEAIGSYGSAANERSISGVLDVPLAGIIVAHVDGSYSKTDDLRTGGYILSDPLRAIAAQSDEEEIRENAELRGDLTNSAAERWTVTGGLSIVTDTGNLGFTISHYDNQYGVPPRLEFEEEHHDHEDDHGHDEHGHSHENVVLAMKQTRYDLRGEIETGGGFLERIRLRAAAADYEHSEIEDSGEIGTSFYNQGYEGRLELVQSALGAWQGAIGGQFFVRDFNVIGEEKFVPRNRTEQYGIFTLQSFDWGAFKAEAGARYESASITAFADEDLGNPDLNRSFDSFSASLGASYAIGDGLRIGLNGTRSERAPSAEELYPNGPHMGTQSFEVGDPTLDSEKAWGLEATFKGAGAGWSFSASAYANWFTDYIYDYQTGAEEDELPVYQYAQTDATYYGFEAEASYRVGWVGAYAINLDGLADYVRAELEDGSAVPRIPPLRLLGGIEAQSDTLSGRLEVEHSFEQTRITAFETPTDGFTLVNASVSWKPWGDSGTSLTLSANNIFDVVARRHASMLKDFAPLAGRDIRVTARLQL